ncbi:integral membrane protein-like protein [Lojkania enalia]|uniref:Integral membrane protein-like protein n=1 Tax=Lojkania enalia TaxID=147567 RepID=A0A9P4N6Z8_9PLEO|nr:integral membrane protein-like protein [Didymosphaeria enalia]
MASSEAQEATAKERIIKHMNADHQDSVRRYLEYAKELPPLTVRHAKMTDINLDRMTFEYGRKEEIIKFDPPLGSLREARERLVKLDQDCLKGLGRSDIRIAKYIPPYTKPFHFVNFSVCLLTYLAFWRPANFKPGSLLFDYLLFRYPAFSSFCLTIQPYLFTIMCAIHAFESTQMVKKLEKHNLLMDEGIWWAWVGSCFVEGVTSFWRLDGLIEDKTKEKGTKKH